MKYEETLKDLAPCGLDCRRCFAHSQGEIKLFSAKLQDRLGSFEIYAKRFSKSFPVFINYAHFKKMLEFFSQGNCKGCRKGSCKFPEFNCGIMACHKKKGVDFCFQCKEFPCNKTNFSEPSRKRWIQRMKKMKKVGVETYCEETKMLPRYR